MRGKYNMSDLELKGWSKTILKIIEDFKSTKGYCSQDLTKLNLCPANVVAVLKNLNWTLNTFDSNGWQQDTWYTFFHEDYKFELSLNYTGYTFEMSLSKDEEEEDE